MGFLDKVQDSLNQGQQKLDAVQNKRALEAQLVTLGKWVYATRTGQDGGRGEAEIDIALHQITSMVGQYGMFDLPFATPGAGNPGGPPVAPAPAPSGFPAPGIHGSEPGYDAPPPGAGAPPQGSYPPPGAGAPPQGSYPPPGAGAPPAPQAQGTAPAFPTAGIDPSAPGGLAPDQATEDEQNIPGGPPPGFGGPPPA